MMTIEGNLKLQNMQKIVIKLKEKITQERAFRSN